MASQRADARPHPAARAHLPGAAHPAGVVVSDVLAGPARPTLAAGPGRARSAGRLRRSVTTVEIAEAAALGDLAAALCVLTRLVPAGGVGVLLAAFPLAVFGYRRRAQTCSIAVVTAFAVAFLGGGVRPAASAVAAGALGSLIGIGLRRGWSVPRIVGAGGCCPSACRPRCWRWAS